MVDVTAEPAQPAASSLTLRQRLARGWGGRLATASLAILVIVWSIPTLGLLISSFRYEDDIRTSGWWTVFANPLDFTQWTLNNYGDVIFGEGMGNAFINTIVVTVPVTIVSIVIAAWAAYGFAWMRFRFREPLFFLFLAMLVVPLQVAFIPLLRLWVSLGISSSFLAIWITHVGFSMPIALLILRNFIGALPHELIEAARVDGASHNAIFWRVVMPLSIPALVAFGVFHFLWVWNDYLVSIVFLGSREDVRLLTVSLQTLLQDQGTDFHLLAAGAFVTMAVPVAVFLALQRYFVRGLLGGSVKE